MTRSLPLVEFIWNGNDWVWNGTRASAVNISDVGEMEDSTHNDDSEYTHGTRALNMSDIEGSGDYYDNDYSENTYDAADNEIDTGFSATSRPEGIGAPTTTINTTTTVTPPEAGTDSYDIYSVVCQAE